MEKFAEEKEASRNAIREELRSEFQVQFDQKEQELIAKLDEEKEALLADFEEEMKTEKAAMKKMILKRFPRSDSDGDGDLSEKELEVVVRIATVRAKKQGSHGQGFVEQDAPLLRL